MMIQNIKNACSQNFETLHPRQNLIYTNLRIQYTIRKVKNQPLPYNSKIFTVTATQLIYTNSSKVAAADIETCTLPANNNRMNVFQLDKILGDCKAIYALSSECKWLTQMQQIRAWIVR